MVLFKKLFAPPFDDGAVVPDERIESFIVVGTDCFDKDIRSIGWVNPDYSIAKKEVVESGLIGFEFHKYEFTDLTFSLQPEYFNKKYPDSVHVFCNDKHIGWIAPSCCKHVRKVLARKSYTRITGTINGGPSKILEEYEDDGKTKTEWGQRTDDFNVIIHMLNTQTIDNKSLQFIKDNIENFPLHMQFYLLAKAEDLAEAKKKKKEVIV